MRRNFPTLRLNKGYIYLDNAATSLKLRPVIKTLNTFTKKFSLNLHSSSGSDDHFFLEKTIYNTRELVAKWMNAKANEVSFIPSTTYALNFLALGFADLLKPGHSIATTKVEHSSNIYPWMNLSKRKKLKLNYLWLDNQFAIDKKRVFEKVDHSTAVVSFAYLSNSLGSVNDVKEITKIIKLINPNCYVIIDASQGISNSLIDIRDWGVDALVFSSHKFYGPDGIAVLWVRETLAERLPHLLWGGGKKASPFFPGTLVNNYQQFEVGTIPAPQVAGLGEVFHFLSKLNWKSLIVKQRKLRNYATSSLLGVDGVKIYNDNAESNILLFNIEGFHSQDVSLYLAKNKIFVRAGDFCSPFLGELIGRNSAVRLSLAIYNNRREINTLVSYLQKLTIDNCLE